jgi:hypothetical protein
MVSQGGFLWLTTSRGVLLFDGVKFENIAVASVVRAGFSGF